VQNFVAAVAFGPDFGGAGAASANRLERTTDAHVSNATIGAPFERDDSQVQTTIVQNGATSGTPSDGAATAGSPSDGSIPSTITNTTTNKSLLPAVGAVSINAKASVGAKKTSDGGAAGAGPGRYCHREHLQRDDDGVARWRFAAREQPSVTADTKSGYNAPTPRHHSARVARLPARSPLASQAIPPATVGDATHTNGRFRRAQCQRQYEDEFNSP
jgi:hypothetical protein